MSVRIAVAKVSPAAWLTALAGLGVLFYVLQQGVLSAQWSAMVLEIQAIQRDLHKELAAALRAIKADGVTAAWSLVFLSFFYGIFHAAGPGHGKVVISTYLLTQESQLRRGILLSVLASLTQGLTAIVAVTGCVTLLGFSMRQAQRTAGELETISYALVALVGLMLVWSRGRRLFKRRPPAHAHVHAHDHGHAHAHGHADDHPHDHAHGHAHDHSHDHSHAHAHAHDDACSSCGHAHGPTREELDQPLSWRGLLGMVASVGLRPCSGAIVVLLVAHSLQLSWAGVGAVVAMSIGTAITVSALATLSVYARTTSLRLAEMLPGQGSRIGLMIDIAGAIGGVIILLAGIMLFQAAWTAPAHPLM